MNKTANFLKGPSMSENAHGHKPAFSYKSGFVTCCVSVASQPQPLFCFGHEFNKTPEEQKASKPHLEKAI